MGTDIEILENQAILKLNPKIYPLEVIYSAAYVFMDRAYIMLDGDPKEEIIVKIDAKKGDAEKLGKEFFNELINYADYSKRSDATKEIREIILQRAMITNDPNVLKNDEEFDKIMQELSEEEMDDPDNVIAPWEDMDDD